RPRLKRNIFDFDVVWQMRVCARAIDALRIHGNLNDAGWRPETRFAGRRAEVQSSVRPMRSRAGRNCGSLRSLCEHCNYQQSKKMHVKRPPVARCAAEMKGSISRAPVKSNAREQNSQ